MSDRAPVRPEIQALRAIAVGLVLVFHAWPSVLPGGFVGVDVFFAISGFLITSHLLREVDRAGRVRVSAFWARRARRILPAALVVLAACTLATLACVPAVHWQQFLAETRAATVYVENWQLAHSAVDYLAQDDLPSPVQHFWSLSAEEQFYLVWPLLIAAALMVASRRHAIAVVLSAVTALSFVYGFRATGHNPAAAYFVTPARAWEFGAGGLLAFAPSPTTAPAMLRRAAGAAGLVAVAVAAALYSSGTPFPGAAALLPVAGALAVIWADRAGVPMRSRPVQFLGDISYSTYLWHWPLLVVLPIVAGRALRSPEIGAALVLTILAAWLTKALVEDPIRHGRALRRRSPATTFGAVAIGMLGVLALTGLARERFDAQLRAAHRSTRTMLAHPPRCFGAAARDPRRHCTTSSAPRTVVPAPIEAPNLPNAPCPRVERRSGLTVCAFGARKNAARATIALIGDSHASHWRAALDVVAEARRWRGLSLTHTSCPLSAAAPLLPEPERSDCIRWRTSVLRWLRAQPEIARVVVAQSNFARVVADGVDGEFNARAAGYEAAWNALPNSVRRLIVIRDTPRMLEGGRTLDCVTRAITRHEPPDTTCARPRNVAVQSDPAVSAAARIRSRHVEVVDLTRYFCDQRRCLPVIGGVLVYKDVSHITSHFATSLGPILLARHLVK